MMHSKRIKIIIPNLITFGLKFDYENVLLISKNEQDEPFDAIVTLPISSGLAYLRTRDYSDCFKQGMNIEGDIQIVTELKNYLQQSENWEKFMPDVLNFPKVNHTIKQQFKKILQKPKAYINSIKISTQEYLQYDLNYLPVQWEVDLLTQSIDTLRDDTERLMLKIQELQS